jgi:hypothetical protein
MTDNRSYRRDVRGRFVRVLVELAYADDSRFPTVAREGIDVGFEGADPAEQAYRSVPRYAPAADELAQGGQRSPLRARRPELVHPDEVAHTVYGVQGAVLRTAARRSAGRWDDDPTPYLVGLATHGTPATGVQEVSDGG